MKKYLFYILVLFIPNLLAAGGIVVVQVSPEKINLRPGQKYKFVAHAYDQEGNEVFFRPDWQCSGGTIDDEGNYLAGGKNGVYEVIASHTATGANGSGSVMIDFNSVQHPVTIFPETKSLRLIPSNIAVKPGQKVQFIVQAFDNRGQKVKPPKNIYWKVNGGSITPRGLFQAGGISGSYTIEVRESGGAYAQAQVYINVTSGGISRISINPSTINIQPGQQYRFFATAYNRSGQIVSFYPEWQTNGGTIDSNGTYYANRIPGQYIVQAIADNGIKSTALVNVSQVYVYNAQVTPKGVTLFPGQTQKFTVVAYDRQGNTLNAFPTWSADGGIIQANGLYRAGNIPGNYKLTAQIENFTITAPINIVPFTEFKRPDDNVNIKIVNEPKFNNEPVKIEISPRKVKLEPGESVSFKITGYDANGQKTKIKDLNIYAKGGRMNEKGIYTAGQKEGNFKIKVSTPTGLSSIAQIKIGNPTTSTSTNNNIQGNITESNPPEQNSVVDSGDIRWLTISPQFTATVPGRETQFEVKGYDASGKEIPCNISWSSSQGNINANGVFVSGDTIGTCKVYASIGDIKAEATVIVKAPENPINKEQENLKLIVIPPKVRLQPGESCNFNANIPGKNSTELKLEWTTDGGKINNKGAFTATNTPGQYWVNVVDKQWNVKQQVEVVVEKPKTETVESKPGAIFFQKWHVKQEASGLARIHINGKVLLEDTAMLKLLLQRDDYEELVYQLVIKKNQRFSIQGTHYVAGGKKLEIVLYNANGEAIHRESK